MFSGRRRLLRKSSFPFPSLTANRHAARSGELHNVWHGQSLPYAHLPLNDALPGSRSFRVGRLPLIRQQQQQCCCYLIYKFARFMAVRRRRPLIPSPYPRRNRYTPLSPQNPLSSVSAESLRLTAKTAPALLLLLFPCDSLRRTRTGTVEARIPPRLRLAENQRGAGSGTVSVRYCRKLPLGIVTHFPVEMCYDSVTILFFCFSQVFANFTISFTGVTFASRR